MNDDPANLAYITPEAAEARALLIGTLTRYRDENLIDRLEVVPEYRGDSMVPSSIVMSASHGRRPGRMEMTLAVW